MANNPITIPTQGEGQAWLVESARQYVLNLWNEHRDKRLVYHNFSQTAEVARLTEIIGRQSKLADEVIETAVIAAWFHSAGYLYDYHNFTEKSAVSAEFFLAERRFPSDKIHRVRQCIVTAMANMHPKPLESQLLCDAITAYNLTESFDKRAPLLRLEWELVDKKKMTDVAWHEYLFQQLLDAVFYLGYTKTAYEPLVNQQFLKQKQVVDGLAQLASDPDLPIQKVEIVANKAGISDKKERFEGLGKGNLRSAIQTYFRTNMGNHIQLSAIADNKAHIMISVNSILISVAISMLTYKTLTNQNPMLMLPIVIFLVTSLTSLIFAVLSSRPRVNNVAHVMPNGRVNPIFFGNFIHLTPEQYEETVDHMLRDGAVLYGNLSKDLYNLGKVLDQKYRMLIFSYNVFMLGFVATVVSFLVAYFIG
jgi:predicted metal-dependent HD superfamily phosphohydrolase